MISKQILFDVFFTELGCSKAMKDVLENIIKNWETFVWNAYEIFAEDDKVKIKWLFDDFSYQVNKEDFFNLLDEYILNC